MKKTRLIILCACTIAVLAETAIGQTTKTVYFVRHAEDHVALYQQGQSGKAFLPDCKPFLNEGVLDECCTEVLNPLGEERARQLARWFKDQGLLSSITHVVATHKVRTLQTVLPIAQAAGLGGDLNGDGTLDGADVDLHPGDGVQQIPAFITECQAGFEVAHNFYPLVLDHLRALPPGSGVVVAGHSASLYPIMQNLGIDTSDPKRFPKNAVGRVNGYNNLWIVELDANNQGTLLLHMRMNFALAEQPTP